MRSFARNYKRARPLLGTYVTIEVQAMRHETELAAAVDAGFAAITEIDRLMAVHRNDSDISRLNRSAPHEWIDIHPHTRHVLALALDLYRRSAGAFDIRCGAALQRWNLLPGKPSTEKIISANPPLELRGHRARKTGQWTIDLGGIAKGYAVDRAVNTIRLGSKDIQSGVVNAGGDLSTWGRWATLGIRSSNRGHLQSTVIPATAVATSTVRPESYARTGQRVSAHVRMPDQTASRREQTATVFANRCIVADALTKVLLLAPRSVSTACLRAYRARALLFGSQGALIHAFGS